MITMSPIIKIVALAIAGGLSYTFFTSADSEEFKGKLRNIKKEAQSMLPDKLPEIPESSLIRKRQEKIDSVVTELKKQAEEMQSTNENSRERGQLARHESQSTSKKLSFDLKDRAASAQEKLVSFTSADEQQYSLPENVEEMTPAEKQALENRRKSVFQKQLNLVDDLLR